MDKEQEISRLRRLTESSQLENERSRRFTHESFNAAASYSVNNTTINMKDGSVAELKQRLQQRESELQIVKRTHR